MTAEQRQGKAEGRCVAVNIQTLTGEVGAD